MPTPTETVLSFLGECGKGKAAMTQAFQTYFTPQTRWELVGAATTTGVEEAIALMRSAQDAHGMEDMFVETWALAVQGNKVLTERTDNVRDAAGNILMATPTMGIFEVEGDKIIAWRDYYDTATHH